MSNEEREVSGTQSVAMSKAIAVTTEQLAAAIKIADRKFSSHPLDHQTSLLGAVIQALATNYLAEVTRTTGKK
nr:hypothetical protein [uncultured Rhodoferax sp.]